MDKLKIARKIFESQDLGLKSIERAVECVRDNVPYTENDLITAHLVDIINEADEDGDENDIYNAIDYTIDQLKRAKSVL